MIRILFMIVAFVAAILGVVLPMPVLFVAAGLALVITIVLMLVRIKRRRASRKQAVSAYSDRRTGGDDELSSLGILEIRPRQKEGASAGSSDRPSADPARSESSGDGVTVPTVSRGGAHSDAEGGTPGRVETGSATRAEVPPAGEREGVRSGPARKTSEPGGASGHNGEPTPSSITVKEKTQTVRASVDEAAPEHYRDVLVPFLQAFRAAIEANTVCLLRQTDDALHFQIESIVSLNAYARSGGRFSTRVPLLQTHDSRSAADIRRVADEDFPSSGLGYYREAIAVKELAVASVPRPSASARYVLLADSMRERGLDSDRSRSLMSHFARLIGAVLDKGAGADVLDAYDYVRPRREIITEEMDRARTEGRPLALALVYLNRAEEVADLGEREVRSAERSLAGHLRRNARDARVERFGELTFGVFFAATGPEVERWAVALQRDLEEAEGVLEGGVSIGIALLQHRHEDADVYRRDATDALREAFESGTCTIVE